MIGNYIKVATRNMAKRKLYSFINAFGLSIGIAFCVLIYLYIQDEKSFDRFHGNKDRIYRLDEKSYDTWLHDPAKPYRRTAYIPLPCLDAVKDELPEVEYGTHFISGETGAMQYQDKIFTESYALVDAEFFKMFSFPLLKGNAGKLFQTKDEVVITPEIAKKYFGDEDPIGKLINLNVNGDQSLTVTGVIEAPPSNSSLTFKMLVPIQRSSRYARDIERWGNFSYPTFVQVAEHTDMEKFGQNLDKVIQKYMGEKLKQWAARGNVPPDVKLMELEYTQLPDMHMKKEVVWEKVSDPQYSLILGGIAILILIIACINYISLALTTSAARRVEVGIRKVVGAQKKQLIYQFGFESVMLALISMVFAGVLITVFLPFFNDFTQKSISISTVNMLPLIGASLGFTVVVGLLAGSYPSFFLSHFLPSQVLKGGFTSRLQAGFTKPLVIFQFALSAFLIISSVIMFRQMQFVTTKDLGFNKDQILVIPTQVGWGKESDQVIDRYRQRLSQEPAVISVTGTSTSFNQGFSRYGYKIKEEQKSAYVYAADPNYIPTLDLKLTLGRNFDERIATDSNAVIVNEALVRDMGWTDPLNEHLNFEEDTTSLGAHVIGVVKDYHFLSLEKNIEPMFLSMNRRSVGYLTTILVKISADDIPKSVENLTKAWRELFPTKPFDYTFLDEDVARQYDTHKRWMSIMQVATGFAILIACLGLFGLAGINAINRTKEIGIRKVMGAGLGHIFILLNKQYVWLALFGFTLAAPLSWYLMNRWLSSFQFKITLGWELFAVSMLAGLGVALLTVSYHAVKAALVNPAETLKYE